VNAPFKQSIRDLAFGLGERVIPKKIRYGGPLLAMRQKLSYWSKEGFLISYPKSGRTWLRVMLGRAIDRHFDLKLENPMELQHLWKKVPELPAIDFSHDDHPNLKFPNEIEVDKSKYHNKKILFLVRDPRDVLVSYFFDAKFRMGVQDGEISDYLRHGRGSIDSIIAFYNSWSQARDRMKLFEMITYEDMHRDPKVVLARSMQVLGLPKVADDVLDDAVSFGSFDNLKKIEMNDAFGHERMRPADKANPESFKVRRGKTGGYVDYLSEDEIAFVNERIETTLDSYFSIYKLPNKEAV
jgi:hypothetical protein